MPGTQPIALGLFLASTISGQIITKTGRWKGWLVGGAVMLSVGLGMLGTIRYDTAYWQVAVYMLAMGLGVGMMMQNLVLATQNQVAVADTVRGFKEILDGKHDTVPEGNFYMKGGIEEVST